MSNFVTQGCSSPAGVVSRLQVTALASALVLVAAAILARSYPRVARISAALAVSASVVHGTWRSATSGILSRALRNCRREDRYHTLIRTGMDPRTAEAEVRFMEEGKKKS